MRVIAFLLLLAVLPTAELTEQVVHVVEHALEAEIADHAAHHDDTHQDEHGCTGLIHLCGCHHPQVTITIGIVARRGIESAGIVSIEDPSSLVDLTTREPAQRPPIG
jgi:hypothetical protein